MTLLGVLIGVILALQGANTTCFDPKLKNTACLTPLGQTLSNSGGTQDVYLSPSSRLAAEDASTFLSIPFGNLLLTCANGDNIWYTTSNFMDAPDSRTGHGDAPEGLVLQRDGNLVIYNSAGRAKWNSGTQDQGGVELVLHKNNNMVLYSDSGTKLWQSFTMDLCEGDIPII